MSDLLDAAAGDQFPDAPGRSGATAEVDPDRVLATMLALGDRQDSLVGLIAITVARDIIEGRLAPGDDLNSILLAGRFTSSRTPVREALLFLEKAGLVDIPARRRPRVIALTPNEIGDIYTLRGNLHGVMGSILAKQISTSGLQTLDAIVSKMASAAEQDDVDEYFWANVSFHEACAGLAGNNALKRSLDGLGIQVLRLRHTSMSIPGRLQLSLHDHQRLVRAFREADANLASALNQSIVDSAYKALLNSMESRS